MRLFPRANIDKISEIGCVFRERQNDQSGVSLRIYAQYLLHLLRLCVAILRDSRFCLVGASGVVVDVLILFLLSDPTMLGWGLTRSEIIAAETAMANNFLWNDSWIFSDIGRRSVRDKFHRFLKFKVIWVLNLILNLLILNILFNWFGMNRHLANGIAIIMAISWNYLVNERLGWRSTSENVATTPNGSVRVGPAPNAFQSCREDPWHKPSK